MSKVIGKYKKPVEVVAQPPTATVQTKGDPTPAEKPVPEVIPKLIQSEPSSDKQMVKVDIQSLIEAAKNSIKEDKKQLADDSDSSTMVVDQSEDRSLEQMIEK